MARARSYIGAMSFAFCRPTAAKAVPSGDGWFHEVKYDGYRLRIERDGKAVRLVSMGGHDYTSRYPWIVAAALKNRQRRFVIDGEAVVLGLDGVSDFSAMHSGRHNSEVQLCAFDVLAIGGDDLRELALEARKARLERLLRGRPDGIFVNPFETDDGPALFGAACRMQLEGIVSKRATSRYRGGPSRDWIKVKNREHQAFYRVAEAKGRPRRA